MNSKFFDCAPIKRFWEILEYEFPGSLDKAADMNQAILVYTKGVGETVQQGYFFLKKVRNTVVVEG